jgi:hypothetical protein
VPAIIDVRAFDKVVTGLHGLVLDPGSLVGVMEEISKAAGSEGAALFQTDVRTPDVPHTPGLADLFKRYFAEGWQTRDLRMCAEPQVAAAPA